MKLAICNETYEGWAFDDVCRDVAAAGYDGIEVALSAIVEDPPGLKMADARELGATATRHGLEVVGLHWLFKGPPRPWLHIASSDPDNRDATVGYLLRQGSLCRAMGGQVLVLGSPQQRNVPDGADYEEFFGRAVETCREVAKLGEVPLALEPLGADYTNFLTTAAETVRLIEAVDHPACKLHLDVFAMSTEAEPIPDIIRAHAAHLVHVHTNDTSMGGPGTGDVDYPAVLAALRDVGYDDYLSTEVFDMTGGGPKIARDSIAFLTSLL